LIARRRTAIMAAMKIYTRTGDDGSTGLIGGERVRKCDARIECYGTVDELNAAIGLAAVAVTDPAQGVRLRRVQNDLFVVGSHLATPDAAPAAVHLPSLDDAMVDRLEMEIDAAEGELAPLRQFILPGGTEAAARLHLARTVCRRAERLLVEFALDRPVPAVVLTYLNRLSDWLFVQARLANHLSGVPDAPWVRENG
jgi:cob(I)alamin adenosyltransferase